MTADEWVGIGIFMFGAALVVAGVWIKAGPEMAMILAGGSIAWVGAKIFTN